MKIVASQAFLLFKLKNKDVYAVGNRTFLIRSKNKKDQIVDVKELSKMPELQNIAWRIK